MSSLPAPDRHQPSSLTRLAALAWLGLITLSYLGSLLTLGREALQRGAIGSGGWATLGVVLALGLGWLGLGVVAGRRPGGSLARQYVTLGLGGAGLLAALAIGLGQALGAALIVTGLMLLAAGLGQWLLRGLGCVDGVEAEQVPLAIGLGCGLLSHLTLGLALAGLLHGWVVLAVLLLLALLCHNALAAFWHALAGLLAGGGQRPLRSKDQAVGSWFAPPLLTLVAVSLLLTLVAATAPETGYDALSYHLALPATYIEQGRLVTTPENVQSWFYLGTEMLFLLAMLAGGPAAAKLVHFMFLPLTALALYGFAARQLTGRVGLLAAGLWLVTPIVAWEATTAYIDLAVTAYTFLAVSATARWWRSRSLRWLMVAGLCAGFALSAKLSAIFLLLPLGVLVAITALAAAPRLGWRAGLPPLVFASVVAVAAAPWPLVRWLQTGNPVFPFYNQLFASPLWPADLPLPLTVPPGFATDLGSLLRLPWEVTFRSDRFQENRVPSLLGPSLVLLPLLALGRPLPPIVRALLGLLLPFLLLWATIGNQYLRFLVPGLPVILLLASYALSRLERLVGPPVVGAILLIWVATSLPLGAVLSTGLPERLPWRVVYGLERREAFLARALPAYTAYQTLAASSAPQPLHLLTVGDEARLYAPGRLEPPTTPALYRIVQTTEPALVLALLRQRGITHLLIDRTRPAAWLSTHPLGQPAFLAAHAEIEYSDTAVTVYRLRSE